MASQVKNQESASYKQQHIQKFLTLGQLTANISHEVKNILLSITGYCELAKLKKQNNDSFDEELEMIHKAALTAQRIFMQLLSFSRDGKEEENHNIDINAVLEDVFLMTGPLPSVKIEKIFEPELPLFLSLDSHKIRQVFLNMIMNAVHAMGDKGGKITIVTKKIWQNMGVCIEITDTGCGMSAEVLSKLFTPFFTTKKAGTGLGLSVSKDIISSQNGSIVVESQVGQGTTFRIFLVEAKYPVHPDIIDL